MSKFPDVPKKENDNTKYQFTLKESCDEESDPDYLGLREGEKIELSDNKTVYSKDDETTHFRQYSILHGRGNYVASLRFLYTVAYNLMNNTYTGSKIKILKAAIEDSLGDDDIANNTFYGEYKQYANPTIAWTDPDAHDEKYQFIEQIEVRGQFNSLEQRLTLEKFVYLVANTYCTGQAEAFAEARDMYSNVTNEKRFETRVALKLIGLATHLCGDIYAHKTVVPLSTTFSNNGSVPASRNNTTIYKGSEMDFNGNGRWSARNGIKTLIQAKSTITTQQITQWQKAQTAEEKKLRTDYPDSTAFYKERLNTGAKKLIKNMYTKFFGGEALATKDYKFKANWFLHADYSLRLANLKLYVYSIGSQPTSTTYLERLTALDSAVAMSDVVPEGGYKLPGDSGTTWKKGIVASY